MSYPPQGEGITRLSELQVDTHKNWLGYLLKNIGVPVDAGDALRKGTRVTMAEVPAGASGYYLKAQGAGADPAYAEIAVDPVAGTPGLRTLGAGGQQAAAGNHTHTLQGDTIGSGKETAMPTVQVARYQLQNNIDAGATLAIASVNLTFASVSRAVGVAWIHAGSAYVSTFKVQLMMGGVLVAESAYFPSQYENMQAIGTRALSGSQTCSCSVKNYAGETRSITRLSNSTSEPVAGGIGVGSIKI